MSTMLYMILIVERTVIQISYHKFNEPTHIFGNILANAATIILNRGSNNNAQPWSSFHKAYVHGRYAI
jgi:hypothetical protein